MDPFLNRIFNFEVPEGAAADGGAAAAPAAVAEAAAPAEPVEPAPTPLHETQEFRDAVANEVDARWQGLLQGMPQPDPAPQPAGQAPDLNEMLSPLSDNFGENLARFLADRDRWLMSQFDEKLQPVYSREEQAQIDAGKSRMDELVTTHWGNPETNGVLSDEARTAIKDLAPSYLPEFEARYGAGPMAAEQALAKAASTIRALNASARGGGAQANADTLAAVAGAAAEPNTGGGAIQVPPAPKSERDVLARYFGSGLGGPQAA